MFVCVCHVNIRLYQMHRGNAIPCHQVGLGLLQLIKFSRIFQYRISSISSCFQTPSTTNKAEHRVQRETPTCSVYAELKIKRVTNL